MNVLVACEFSGAVRDAFRRKGHDAFSCDLLPGHGEFSHCHVQGDVIPELENPRWDMVIGFPPCTYLCNSGVRWLIDDELRFDLMEKACVFFNKILDCPAEKIVAENPIQHGYARQRVRKYDQIIQPWQHGHGETKATCLWVKGVDFLKPSKIVAGRVARIHRMPPGPDRSLLRSITLPGVADAFADQWG